MLSIEKFKRFLKQAQGVSPADLVLKDCTIVNVFTREMITGDVAICGGRIAGIGQYSGVREMDCRGYVASPGFIEGHIHIESTMLSPRQFVNAVIGSGTTTVVCDPHEIANVAGAAGIRYILDETEGLPVNVFVMAPSCVPATHLETSGAVLDHGDISRLYNHPRVIGLAEMMNYPGVVAGDDEIIEKIIQAHNRRLPIDGHAPGLTGKSLQAYVCAGIGSDHECTTEEEAREKLRAGMHVFIREGSVAKNLEDLLPVVNERNVHRCLLVTDDCHPHDLLNEGHLDRILRKAIASGLDPLMAIQMVSINVARYFSFPDRGAIGPGYRADLVLFKDIRMIRPCHVFSAGRQIVRDGSLLERARRSRGCGVRAIFSSVTIRPEKISFKIPAEKGRIRVIKVREKQIATEAVEFEPKIEEGLVVADPERDLAKIAVIERHGGSGDMGVGFVTGMGLHRGALASSIAHDSHNIVVIGVSDADMRLAVEAVARAGGGMAVVCDGRILSLMELHIAGLMSVATLEDVNDDLEDLLHSARSLGVHEKNPFMLMSFLALPVIPDLKLTDQGLVDVTAFKLTGLWV